MPAARPYFRSSRQVVAGAAAAVEDRGVGPAANRLGEKRGDEPPEAAEPEMVALGARGGFEKSVHRQVGRIDSMMIGR